MLKPSMLCPNTTVCYVAGYGGLKTEDYETLFQQMVQSIFGLYFEPELQVLPNKSPSLLKEDENLVARIGNIAKECKTCDLISLVWFCHSQGAKMVCEAYKHLQDCPGFSKIKEASAIICIGGIALATPGIAKVVLNVEFENDDCAKGGSAAIGDRGRQDIFRVGPFADGKCKCCNGVTKCQDAEYQVANRGIYEHLCGVSALLKSGISSVRSTSFSAAHSSHYIEDYVRCKKWKKEVRQLLPVALGTLCQRHHGD